MLVLHGLMRRHTLTTQLVVQYNSRYFSCIPFLLNKYISRNHFVDILGASRNTNEKVQYDDSFLEMRHMEELWNNNMEDELNPGWINVTAFFLWNGLIIILLVLYVLAGIPIHFLIRGMKFVSLDSNTLDSTYFRGERSSITERCKTL